MTWPIHLTTICNNKNWQHDAQEKGTDYQHVAWLNQNALQKQVFKRVTAFQASLKLVQEGAGAQLSNKDNNHLTSHGSNYLC